MNIARGAERNSIGENKMSEDLISRKQAIRAIENFRQDFLSENSVILVLSNLPSAEPEERTAKVKEGWGFAVCECGHRVFEGDIYCAHCGAKLVWRRE